MSTRQTARTIGSASIVAWALLTCSGCAQDRAAAPSKIEVARAQIAERLGAIRGVEDPEASKKYGPSSVRVILTKESASVDNVEYLLRLEAETLGRAGLESRLVHIDGIPPGPTQTKPALNSDLREALTRAVDVRDEVDGLYDGPHDVPATRPVPTKGPRAGYTVRGLGRFALVIGESVPFESVEVVLATAPHARLLRANALVNSTGGVEYVYLGTRVSNCDGETNDQCHMPIVQPTVDGLLLRLGRHRRGEHGCGSPMLRPPSTADSDATPERARRKRRAGKSGAGHPPSMAVNGEWRVILGPNGECPTIPDRSGKRDVDGLVAFLEQIDISVDVCRDGILAVPPQMTWDELAPLLTALKATEHYKLPPVSYADPTPNCAAGLRIGDLRPVAPPVEWYLRAADEPAQRKRGVGGLVPKNPKALPISGPYGKHVQKVIDKNIGQIHRCYERELAKTPGLSGKIQVEWTIKPSGRVGSARQTFTSIRSTPVSNCVVGAIHRWMFPRPRGGEVIVNYPFIFKPASD